MFHSKWLALLNLQSFQYLPFLFVSMVIFVNNLNSALSGLTQSLASERDLKMMRNAFYFILKALSIPKIFKFLFFLSFWSCLKQLD